MGISSSAPRLSISGAERTVQAMSRQERAEAALAKLELNARRFGTESVPLSCRPGCHMLGVQYAGWPWKRLSYRTRRGSFEPRVKLSREEALMKLYEALR